MRMTGTKIDPKRSLADIVSPTYLYSVSGSRQLEEDFVISVKHPLRPVSPKCPKYWQLRVLPGKKRGKY